MLKDLRCTRKNQAVGPLSQEDQQLPKVGIQESQVNIHSFNTSVQVHRLRREAIGNE